MARAKKSKTKPAVKSSAQKIPKIGWGQSSRNANTFRKLEKANDEEKVYFTQAAVCFNCGSDNLQERSGSQVCFSCGNYQ
jgi:imidazoleglycerol phosphate synthase glutamine amidotransferase subunit HisH